MNINKDIIEAIEAIEKNTSLFYQQKDKEGYDQFDHTLGILMQTVNQLSVNKSEYNEIHIDEQTLNTILGNAMNAIESGDTILLSDILYFDLKPLLEECLIN